MLKAFSNVFFVLFASILFQNVIFAQESTVVAEFEGKKITLNEFEEEYVNNFGDQSDPKMEEMKKFLDLYVLFRMKIEEAKNRGYEKLPALQRELQDYRKQVGTAYVIQKKLIEPRIKELFERRKKEYLVAHIMIQYNDSTLNIARKKAYDLIERLEEGEDFEALAKALSEDNSTKKRGGVVGYFTAGMLYKNFEDAMAETEPGEIYPEPVRSRSGFHIIKVLDVIDRVPSIRASHILIDYKTEGGEIDTVRAKFLADSIRTLLEGGADFEELAKEFSEDPNSAERGGDLGFFPRRSMIQGFSDAAFLLETGELSEPVQTKFGFHIIKVTDKKALPEFEEVEEELNNIYRQNFLEGEKSLMIANFKKRVGIRENNILQLEIAKLDDTAKVKEFFELEGAGKLGEQTLLTIGGISFSADSVFRRAAEMPDFKEKIITPNMINVLTDEVADAITLEMMAEEMEKTDADYAELMDEYKEGIFIFRLREDEVWNKVEIDSAALYELWEETREDYRWGDRVRFVEIFKKDSADIAAMMDSLEAGVPFDTLAKKYTERPPRIRIAGGDYGFKPVDDNKMTEKSWSLDEPGEISEVFPVKGGYSVVKLVKKDPARLKTFEEARAEVSGIYQEQENRRLEKQFKEYLYDKYEPEFYYENLEEAFQD